MPSFRSAIEWEEMASWHVCERVVASDGVDVYYFKFNRLIDGPRPTSGDMQKMVDKISEIYTHRRRFRLIVDTRHAPPKKVFKTVIANWMHDNQHLAKAYLDRTGVAVHNSLARFLLQGVFLIRPPTTPVKLFGTLAEAVEFVGIKP
jgi:hypothetical protein